MWQKKKLMMADNKVYELGFTDTDAIEQLVKELDGDTGCARLGCRPLEDA